MSAADLVLGFFMGGFLTAMVVEFWDRAIGRPLGMRGKGVRK